MAYRHFYGAPFLYCWSDGEHICVEELDGRINKYACALHIQTKKQLVTFRGPDAIWCLRDNGILYVGRNDSTFSGFSEQDGTLLRYGPWEYPYKRTFDVVGQWGGYTAALDSDDHRTVYIHDPSRAYILHKPIDIEDLIIPQSLCDAVQWIEELSIYTKGGQLDVKTAGTWVDAPYAAWADNPVQL